MRIKKILAALLAALMLTTMIAGCGQQESPAAQSPAVQSPAAQPSADAPASPQPETSQPSAQTETAPPTERIVVDQLGREVVLPMEVESVVAVHGTMINFIIAMGGGHLLVGRGGGTGSPDTINGLMVPNLGDLPQLGNNDQINVEELAQIGPQLFVFSARHAEVVLPVLDMLGIASVSIRPDDFESILTSISVLGDTFGQEERARNIIDFTLNQLSLVEERLANAPRKPTALVFGNTTTTIGTNGMLQSDIIFRAGGLNTAIDIDGTTHAEVTMEQILEWDPEYIFISAWGNLQPEDIISEPRYAVLQAVQNGNVRKFPSPADWWDTSSTASALAVIWAAHIMHPQLITAEELDAAVTDFYYMLHGVELGKDFFGY